MHAIFETDRLVLKAIGPEGAPGVLNFYTVNKGFIEPWEHLKTPSFYTLAYQEKALELEWSSFQKGHMVRFWLYLKEDMRFEQPIGTVALTNIIRGAFQSCFVGYKMDYRAVQKGYMSEALQKVVEIAFEELKLHRIEANIMPRNIASIGLVKKLGFHEEGLAQKYLKINGVWEDHIHFARINSRF